MNTNINMLKYVFILTIAGLAGCAGSGSISPAEVAEAEATEGVDADSYVIGPGDGLQIFVWGHEDLTTGVNVRPDGNISTPLVEDLPAAGKTPTQLARLVEERLSEFVRTPQVTVIVQSFVGEYGRQVRVVGQAAQPQSLAYRDGMTLLDLIISVGGLSEFAAGNRAKIVRKVSGEEQVIRVRLDDLLNKGDLDQNVRIRPGDVLIIPESFF
ncbi:MAG: XrtA/PEP-CTERM system exopolysaccharide export protein [Woeseiaceae bacterium]